MAHQILILNGPNLNLLGVREPEVYGIVTLDEIFAILVSIAGSRAELRHLQSNNEGDLIDAIQDARTWADGIVFNPAAYTHTSIALRDAVVASGLPVVETHLSNVHAREEWRKISRLTEVCLGVVAGFRADSYSLALEALISHLDQEKKQDSNRP